VYYNPKRTDPGASQLNTESGRINQMFDSVFKEGFNVRTRWSPSTIGNSSTASQSAQQLEQLFFCTDSQIALACWFVSGTMYQTDATFKSNELKLPLATNVGITNTGLTFPFALSYVYSASQEAFSFLPKCVHTNFILIRAGLSGLIYLTPSSLMNYFGVEVYPPLL
jgi:hypothetical protein